MILLIVWELWICEGTHLGRRFVVWLYDLAAFRYDKIKQFDPDWERTFLGEPISTVSLGFERPRILDIGAGTGRVARSLCSLPSFHGTLINLEPSKRMLAFGRQMTSNDGSWWVRSWAIPLPFADGAFDIVISLELLEFTPKPIDTLKEMLRVLQPTGWLLITNRVGRDAPLILGKTYRREDFPKALETVGLQDISVYPWQVNYDLVWARKT
ncbi:MAG TPA: class I SAM-dependent methyltransferase [Anaerolineae bacterium]|nr:class I SAM-dependent methyltransferase [Anaerolineae bacterium]